MTIRHTDGLPDNRVTCSECTHSDGGSFRCRRLKVSILPDLPLRCAHFTPLVSASDQRNGVERWPNLQGDIETERKRMQKK